MKRLISCAAATLLGASLALAVPQPAPPEAVSDADFMRQASTAELAAIAFGRLAVERASNADVKQFAQQMEDAHTKALDAVNKTAELAGFTVARGMDAAHRNLLAKLSALKGADFDRQYLASQMADLKNAVMLFNAQSTGAMNDDVKTLAGQLLPTTQHYLDMAQRLGSDPGTQPAAAGAGKDNNTPPSKDK